MSLRPLSARGALKDAGDCRLSVQVLAVRERRVIRVTNAEEDRETRVDESEVHRPDVRELGSGLATWRAEGAVYEEQLWIFATPWRSWGWWSMSLEWR